MGGDARLKYSYKSEMAGMGMFAIYVVDKGTDIEKDGGIPEIMVTSENESSESALQKTAGKYYLNVTGSGNWTVTVEEMR
jgi:hypothetical protein